MSVFGIDIAREAVCILEGGISKHDALDILIDCISASDAVSDREALRRAVYDRESVMSTGIGSGVAIPHVRIKEVTRPILAVGISPQGLNFDTLDNQPVHIVVLFAMPAQSHKEYLKLLAQVMLALKTPGFRERLLACSSPNEVFEALHDSQE
jgi:mannitol/fructose-specific phosphotransferase system IIA component (Ntr-type)